ncbi:MAG TPA: nuclear transport factor 2 family protein, partial [Pirellulales bacterium]|nr:nuclear transport factor 2 family protein [Pirellulales bacterium]
AIIQAIDSYVDAYNRGDARAVADHWAETGEWVSPSGRKIVGQAAIRAEMEALFDDQPGVEISVDRPSLRFLADDVAVEEGTVHVVRPNEDGSDSTYIAIHVKRDGHWKLDSVRETSLPDAEPAGAELGQLEWLVGRWIDQSPVATVEAGVVWTKNKKFLNWSFKLLVPGMDDLEGTQVIGWDPAAGTIRSWMFDSDGGFGGGTWTRDDDRWIVTFSQVLPDGRIASAMNIYTRVNADTYTWQSTRRQVDGEPLPDIEEVTVVRQSAGGDGASTGRSPWPTSQRE